MKVLKPSFAAIVLIVGLSSAAQAQGVVAGGYATYPGAGTIQDYYTVTSGFGNYGLPGAYPNYSGYGLSGYGPGANLGEYFTATPNRNIGRVSNNMGGLMNSIKQQTGKPGSYRNNAANYGVSPNRRAR
jgi:hypothetical protein